MARPQRPRAGGIAAGRPAFATSWLHERAGAGRRRCGRDSVGTAWWHLAGAREIDQHAHGSGLLSSGTGTPLDGSPSPRSPCWRWAACAACRAGRAGWNVLPLALALSAALALIGQHEAVLALHWPQGTVWLAGRGSTRRAGAAAPTRAARAGRRAPPVSGNTRTGLRRGLGAGGACRGAGRGLGVRARAGAADRTGAADLAPAGAGRISAGAGVSRICTHLVAPGIVLALAWFQSLLLSGDTAPCPSCPSSIRRAAVLIGYVAARWARQHCRTSPRWRQARPSC